VKQFRVKAPEIKTNPYNVQVCPIASLHKPYGNETPYMRYISLSTYIIFGLSYLFLNIVVSLLNKLDDSFIVKAFKLLINQLFMYFVLLSIFIVLYVLGGFDSIRINYEFVINGFCTFILCWILICLVIILLCYLNSIISWEEKEKSAIDFSNINFYHFRNNKKEIREIYSY